MNKLQSVVNAAARLIFSLKKRDLHWLRVQQRIEYKIAVLVYQCLHGLAPAYMSSELQSVKDLPSRQRLRSLSSHFLLVPTSQLSTVGDRAFPVAAARVWNTLSRCVISACFLPAFKRRLKTELFLRRFPEVAPTASD